MREPLLFLDESGFTGEDLFNRDQPVFVLATVFLPEDECQTIKQDFFGRIQATELKHSELRKRPRSQRMVLDFMRHFVRRAEIIKFSILHKRYDRIRSGNGVVGPERKVRETGRWCYAAA